MTEQALSSGPAAVYHYENNQWKPVDGGISTVAVYHNPATGLYRVVAISPTAGAVINSAIFKELTLVKLSENFYNWTDGTTTYGVNFAQVEDASNFAGAIVNSIAALSGGAAAAPKPADSKPGSKGVGLKPAAPSAAAAAKSPAGFQKAAPTGSSGRTAVTPATPASTPAKTSAALTSSPKPAAAAATSPFPSATAAPKTALVSPRGAPSPAASSSSSSSSSYSSTPPSSSASSSSGQLTPEYEAMKQELLSAFRDELERARQEILDSLRR